MKKTLSIFLLLSIKIAVFSQTSILEDNLMKDAEVAFLQINPTIGGDVTIESTKTELKGENIYKTFTINSSKNGDYYLNAWIMVPLTPEGYPEYKVEVNSIVVNSTLKPSKNNWQSVGLTDKKGKASTLTLEKGVNTISIIAKNPEIPSVEFVRLSTNPIKAEISDNNYQDYVAQIKSQPAIVASSQDLLNIADSSYIQTRGTGGQEYTYGLNMPLQYTTFKSFNLQAGQYYTFSATASNINYEFVIEVFNAQTPNAYSWSLYGKGNATIQVQTPVSGIYYVRIRAYNQLTTGSVTLKAVNNQYTYTNCPVGGNALTVNGSISGPRNFFTCNVTAGTIACIWVEEGTAVPGKITGYNMGYTAPSDYNWAGGSKCYLNGSAFRAGLISSYSSFSGNAKCDVYINLPQSDVTSVFPYLKTGDAIRTAPATQVYNCIAWTIDRTDDWIWPISVYSSYYKAGDPLASFDALYAQYNYTRQGSSVEKGVVALWGTSSTNFTHGSIKNNANSIYPHGYDWESKPGALMRTFHPKLSIRGEDYGAIQHYYIPIPNKSRNTVIKNKMEKATLSIIEQNNISLLKASMPAQIQQKFNDLYNNWELTWSNPIIATHSDPRKYAESQEYSTLLDLCKQIGESSILLITEKLSNGDLFAINLLEDLTLSEEQNKSLLIKVKESANKFAKTNNYYPSSIYSNALNYAKELLKRDDQKIKSSINSIKIKELNISSNLDISIKNNTLIITSKTIKPSKIDINIVDINGIELLKDSRNNISFDQKIIINLSFLKDGLYFINTKQENNYISKKIQINKN